MTPDTSQAAQTVNQMTMGSGVTSQSMQAALNRLTSGGGENADLLNQLDQYQQQYGQTDNAGVPNLLRQSGMDFQLPHPGAVGPSPQSPNPGGGVPQQADIAVQALNNLFSLLQGQQQGQQKRGW